MIVLSHRGYWLSSSEKNTVAAFERSFDLGFGTETDVRDCAGKLVISHDMPKGNEQELSEFLKIYADKNSAKNLPLAINIKSDGLVLPLKKAMEDAGIKDWFVFDMSIPDMRGYLREKIPVFARMSEVEKDIAWGDEVSGIWLDGFSGIWYDTKLIQNLIDMDFRVCIVSPELHGREHLSFWQDIACLPAHPKLMICTDLPEQAQKFFEAE